MLRLSLLLSLLISITQIALSQPSFSVDLGTQYLPASHTIYSEGKFSALDLLIRSKEIGCSINYQKKMFIVGVHPRFLIAKNTRFHSVTNYYYSNGNGIDKIVDGVFQADRITVWCIPWTIGFTHKKHQLVGGLAYNRVIYESDITQQIENGEKVFEFKKRGSFENNTKYVSSRYFKYSYRLYRKIECYVSAQYHQNMPKTNVSNVSLGISFLAGQ